MSKAVGGHLVGMFDGSKSMATDGIRPAYWKINYQPTVGAACDLNRVSEWLFASTSLKEAYVKNPRKVQTHREILTYGFWRATSVLLKMLVAMKGRAYGFLFTASFLECCFPLEVSGPISDCEYFGRKVLQSCNLQQTLGSRMLCSGVTFELWDSPPSLKARSLVE